MYHANTLKSQKQKQKAPHICNTYGIPSLNSQNKHTEQHTSKSVIIRRF